MHGCAENSQTDRPYLHSMGPTNGGSTMQQGLDENKVFGIVGNSDHHSAYPALMAMADAVFTRQALGATRFGTG